MSILAAALGLVLGAFLSWVYFRKIQSAELSILNEKMNSRDARVRELEEERVDLKIKNDELIQDRTSLSTKLAQVETQLQEELKTAAEKIQVLAKAEENLTHAFKALSAEALHKNNQSFLDLARTQLEKFQESAQKDLRTRQDAIVELVKPVRESLEKVDTKIQEIEKTRARSDESLLQQVKNLMDVQKDLRNETSNLVTALRAPQGRGMWGEMQLQRVVEMAGMLEYCDFVRQESVTTEAGRLRPDLIVRLPGGKNIVVDAKTPLLAFLEAIQTQNMEQKKEKLKEHARQVRKHLEQLGRKSYWDQFQPAPEFVVLFLPGESFFSAALENDPSLIELGVSQNVILATPTTLIALLRAVAYGWRQEKLADNAKAIAELGKELYKRLSDLGGHFGRLGKNLESAIESYNSAVGSLETRVLVSARRFRDLESVQVSVGEIDELGAIEKTTRSLTAPELDQ